MRIVVLLRCNIPRFKLFYLTAFFDVAYTEISPVSLGCVASVYNRVIERSLSESKINHSFYCFRPKFQDELAREMLATQVRVSIKKN